MGWIEITSAIIAMATIIGIVIGVQRHNAAAHGRIYERLDDVKEGMKQDMKEEYARKDLCALTHQQVEKELREIKMQTALIPAMASQLELLVNGNHKQ